MSLQVCLAGQPELRDAIARPGLAPVRQQILLSCHVGPIALDETGAYIEHRLRKVGWSGTPRFEPGAFDEIHRSSRGIPRGVNVLCNRLLLSRFLESEATVDAATVARGLASSMPSSQAPRVCRSSWAHAGLSHVPPKADQRHEATGNCDQASQPAATALRRCERWRSRSRRP